jgi:microsomal epoxide hydrolase
MFPTWYGLTGGTVDVPMGYCAFPTEMVASQIYTNIQRWTEMPRGGHFAAMEQPEALAAEIQAFFRPLH